MSYINKNNCIDYILLSFIFILILLLCEKSGIFKPKKIHYLYVTGGYDSTFRLCQLVLIKNNNVQPIYINIDNMDGEISRENRELELNTIKNIIDHLNYIIKTDKTVNNRILPLIIINKHNLSEDIILNSYNLYKQKRLNKPISQYTYMCSIAISMNKNIETGVLVEKGGPIYKSIGNILISDRIKLSSADKNQLMFRNLLFPLAGMTKKQMKKIAIKNGFLYILKQTVSCWFPDENNNKCNECNMCRERII